MRQSRRTPDLKSVGLFLMGFTLVLSVTQICQDLDNNAYSIITCRAPGKNGQPGKNGPKGQKGDQGNISPMGTSGFPGPPGPKGDKQYSDNTFENLEANLTKIAAQISSLRNIWRFQKSIHPAAKKIYLANGKQANFATARSMCESYGGTLPSPMTSSKNAAILKEALKTEAIHFSRCR